MLKVIKLTCEYKTNPIGIDISVPRLSWKLESDQKGVTQASYTIQVALTEDFSAIYYDTGEVISDENILIDIEGLQLRSRQRYFYRVKATSNLDEVSEWSEVSYWEMGLLSKNDWQASWIAPPEHLNGEPCPLLKTSFNLEATVASARLYVTSLGLYELHLNGERVGDQYFTPGWTSYQDRVQYQTYDVKDLLTSGVNEWTGLLGNGWYKGYIGFEGEQNFYGDRLSLFAQLEVQLDTGETIVITTDSDWKVCSSPIWMSEIYHGESYNALSSMEEITWQNVDLYYDNTPNVVAQENEPVRKIDRLNPVEIMKTPKNETVIDFGQNMVGWVNFKIQGESGQKVQIQHAEVLDAEGNFYTDNLRSAKQMIEYRLHGNGVEEYEPAFSFQGFRYIKLIGFKPDQIKQDYFTGVVLHSDMNFTGDFKCSDPLINQLQHNIVWGLKGNFLDVPTDCPQRDERLGWTGDAQMFVRTAAYLANVAPFFSKWLKDLKVEQEDDGGIPFVVPNVIKGERDDEILTDRPFSSAAWGDAAVICPWTIYICYGDVGILKEQYSSMKDWVEYIRKQGENEYLWNTGFHFGDWLALDSKPDSYVGATERSYIATAFFAYSTSLVKKTAQVLGNEKDTDYYQELEIKIIEELTNEFVTPNGRLAIPTQTGQVLALMFDLLEGKAKDRAVDKLTSLLEEEKWHLTTGFVGTPYLNHVLSENGRNDIAYRLLFQKDYPSWLYQITKGATTIWEHWDGIKENNEFWSADMNSFNHYAYGAIGDWLYRKVAGIELEEKHPGYKQFTIKPYIEDGLDWAEGTLETMYGPIRSYWKKEETDTVLEITVPVNTIANVTLPDGRLLDERGQHAVKGQGVLSVDANTIQVGSGSYTFKVKEERKV